MDVRITFRLSNDTPVVGYSLEPDVQIRGENLPDYYLVHTWFKFQNSSEWVELASSTTYTPTMEDFGCLLKYECVAFECEMGQQLAPTSSVKTKSVISAPEPCSRRLINDPNEEHDTRGFKVLQYNVLAEVYSPRHDYCPTWALVWPYRRSRLISEIIRYGADIICLQEVQSNHFEDFFRPELSQHGYSAIYKGKTHLFKGGYGTFHEGCATFVRDNLFEVIRNQELEFRPMAQAVIEKLPETVKRNVAHFMKDNVALISVLRFKGASCIAANTLNDCICIVNVHLVANRDCADVRVFQVQSLVKTLEKEFHDTNMPMVLCSDLNSTPNSPPYDLLVRGALKKTDRGSDFDPSGLLKHLSLSHKLPKLESAYASFFGNISDQSTLHKFFNAYNSEPHFTILTRKWMGTIDYIFYTVDSIECEDVLELVDQKSAREHGALPSPIWSSDHLAIMAKFQRR